MRRMAFKRARPVTEEDNSEIQHNWFHIQADIEFFLKMRHHKHHFYSEFYEWLDGNCEGLWYESEGAYFVNLWFEYENDKVKFILKFM